MPKLRIPTQKVIVTDEVIEVSFPFYAQYKTERDAVFYGFMSERKYVRVDIRVDEFLTAAAIETKEGSFASMHFLEIRPNLSKGLPPYAHITKDAFNVQLEKAKKICSITI